MRIHQHLSDLQLLHMSRLDKEWVHQNLRDNNFAVGNLQGTSNFQDKVCQLGTVDMFQLQWWDCKFRQDTLLALQSLVDIALMKDKNTLHYHRWDKVWRHRQYKPAKNVMRMKKRTNNLHVLLHRAHRTHHP